MMLLLIRTAFILVTGALIVQCSWGQEITRNADGLFTTNLLKTTLEVGADKRIVVKSASTLMGRLNITATTTDQVTVEFYKKSRADTRSRAIDYIDLMAVTLGRIGDGVRLQMRAPKPAPWDKAESGVIEATLYVPLYASVEVEALYFDIVAEGPFVEMAVPSSLGRLQVSKVFGVLDLETANRKVIIEEITGDISVTTTNSSLEARNIRSEQDQAVFHNEGGDIMIDGFTGQINVKNSFGRIGLTDFAPVGGRNIIRGRSGPVVVEISRMAEGQVIVGNRFEDIDITVPTSIDAILSLSVDEDGEIEVSNLECMADVVQRTRLSLVTGEGDAAINASAHGGGNIFIRGIYIEDDE